MTDPEILERVKDCRALAAESNRWAVMLLAADLDHLLSELDRLGKVEAELKRLSTDCAAIARLAPPGSFSRGQLNGEMTAYAHAADLVATLTETPQPKEQTNDRRAGRDRRRASPPDRGRRLDT